MLNCTVTCRGADKKPRDNKLEMSNVAYRLSSNFGGYENVMEDNSNLIATEDYKRYLANLKDTFLHDTVNNTKSNIGELFAPLPGN